MRLNFRNTNFVSVATVLPVLLVSLLVLSVPATAKEPITNAPTVEEARAFMVKVEKHLEELGVKFAHASWVQANFITFDSQKLAANAANEFTVTIAQYAGEARQFDGLDLPPALVRKFLLLKLGVAAPAPPDAAEAKEMTEKQIGIESAYGTGKYCPHGEEKSLLDAE